MSTAAMPIRPNSSSNARPVAAVAQGGGGAFATLDPVRLFKRYYPWLIVAAIVGGILGVVAHFALAKFYPTYTALARFECRPPSTDIKSPTSALSNQDDLSRFMMTQAQIMKTSTVLEPACKDPDLENSKWADRFRRNGTFQPKDAQQALSKELNARPIAQTTLLEISLSGRNASATRTVVQAVSQAYLDQYTRAASAETTLRRDALGRQIRELDTAIADKNRERERKLGELKVTDLREGSSTEDLKAARLNEQLVTAEKELSTTMSLLEKYTALTIESVDIKYPEDIRDEAKHDPVVQSLDSRLADLRAEEKAMMLLGYGADHSTVIAIRKRIEAIGQEREEIFDSVARKMFEAQLDRLKTSQTALLAQREQIGGDLEKVLTRKESLTKLRLVLEQFDQDVARWSNERADLVQARNTLEALTTEVFARVRLIQPAQEPNELSFPKIEILVPLGILAMCGLVGGVLVLRELLDQRVKGPADVAMLSKMRVFGMVPEASEDPVKAANLETAFRDAPTGVVSESFRQLRAPLIKSMEQAGHKTLLVLAGMPGSGATTVAANLGLACAGAGERVLIIDANLRRPSMHRVFGLSEAPGLGDCLAGQARLADAVRATTTENVSVLTAGSNANRMLPERLSSETMGRLLGEAAGSFDRVIIDAPPAIVSGDGMALANRSDAVVLVVRALSETRGLVNRVRIQLGEVRGEFLGVIVNAVRSSAGGYFKGNIRATHEYQTNSSR